MFGRKSMIVTTKRVDRQGGHRYIHAESTVRGAAVFDPRASGMREAHYRTLLSNPEVTRLKTKLRVG